MLQPEKKVSEVFQDIEDNNIGICKIKKINLYKKSNKIEVELIAQEPISNMAISKFKQYLIEKLKVVSVDVNVLYEGTKQEIVEEIVVEKKKEEVDSAFIIGKKLDSRIEKVKVIDIDINSRTAWVEEIGRAHV